MMFALLRRYATAALLFVPGPLGAAGEAASERYFTFPDYALAYTLADDATFTESRRWARTIFNEKAVAWAKDASISYSTSTRSADIIEAFTRKADGRRIDVAPSNWQVVSGSGRGAATAA